MPGVTTVNSQDVREIAAGFDPDTGTIVCPCRIVYDPDGSGLSEHGVHHFPSLVLKVYEDSVRPRPART